MTAAEHLDAARLFAEEAKRAIQRAEAEDRVARGLYPEHYIADRLIELLRRHLVWLATPVTAAPARDPGPEAKPWDAQPTAFGDRTGD